MVRVGLGAHIYIRGAVIWREKGVGVNGVGMGLRLPLLLTGVQ